MPRTKQKLIEKIKKQQDVADPEELQKTDRETIIFYKGRHPAFPNAHFYVVKDTNKEITFGKRLQPRHKIGLGYPVKVTKLGRSYGTLRDVPIGETEIWPNRKEIAQWVRDDEAVGREAKRKAEEAGLRTKARKLAEQIKDEYRRANSVTKRDIIAAFVETLEE